MVWRENWNGGSAEGRKNKKGEKTLSYVHGYNSNVLRGVVTGGVSDV